jgi:hypothetical protein
MDGFDRMQVDTDLEQLLNPEFDLELPALGDNITDLIGSPQPGASGMRFQHMVAICLQYFPATVLFLQVIAIDPIIFLICYVGLTRRIIACITVDLLKSQVGGCASWRRSGTAITDVVLFFCGMPGGFVAVNCRGRQPEEYSAAAAAAAAAAAHPACTAAACKPPSSSSYSNSRSSSISRSMSCDLILLQVFHVGQWQIAVLCSAIFHMIVADAAEQLHAGTMQ